MNFFDILYAKKNGAALPTNFFDLLFAKSLTPSVEWGEYDGTLPAQFNANGDDLSQYQVYGNTGGVGGRTANIYDKNSESVNGYVTNSGTISTASENPVKTYDYIAVNSSFISYKAFSKGSLTYRTIRVAFYDTNKNFISRSLVLNDGMIGRAVQLPSGCAFVRLSIDTNLKDVVMVEGSTIPTAYIPYGYEVDMSVSDGTTSTTAPIYIGDTPLEKDEYVDFKEQKVYRMVNGVLTQQDPPVALPALPTCDGTTIVDYAGQSTPPSRFYAKYQKGGV